MRFYSFIYLFIYLLTGRQASQRCKQGYMQEVDWVQPQGAIRQTGVHAGIQQCNESLLALRLHKLTGVERLC